MGEVSNGSFYCVFVVISLFELDKMVKNLRQSVIRTALAPAEVGVVSEILSLVIFPKQRIYFVLSGILKKLRTKDQSSNHESILKLNII